MARGFWTGLPIEMFISGENLSSPNISPDGTWISYLKSTKTGNQLFLFHINKQEHSQLTFGNALSTGTPYGGKTYCWSDDSSKIYYSIKGKIHVVSVNGGDPKQLFTQQFSYAPSHQNQKLIFSVEHETHMSLGILREQGEIEENWPQRIPITESFLYDPVFHPKQSKIAVHSWSFPNMSWNGSKIEIISSDDDFQTITRKTVAGNEIVATSQPKWSPNGEYLTFLHEQSGWLNLWISKNDGTDAKPLVDEPHEHSYSTWVTGGSNYVWIDNSRIIFTRNDKGFFSLAVTNIDTSQTKKIQFKEGYFESLSCSDNKLVVFFSDHETKGQVLLFDLSTLKEDGTIVEPKIVVQSGVRYPTDKICKPIPIEFSTAGDQKCHALLYYNEEKEPLVTAPIIVNIHGGPTGMRTNSWNTNAQYFASRGYLYVELNYRGSIGFGREYRNSLNENWGKLDVEDSIHLLEYLKKEKIGDHTKNAIMGGSAGGFTVLMVLAMHPSKYKAGIDLFGVSEFFSLVEDTHYLESRYLDSMVGPLPEASERYFSLAPFFHAKNIVDPLLILQGEDDPVVLKSQSEMMIDAVSGPVESKFYPEEGHGFQKPENIKDSLERIEKFLKKYVLYKRPENL